MATSAKSANLDLNSVFGSAVSQFRGLNSREPGQWPPLPKIAIWLLVGILMVVAGWFGILQTTNEELEAERVKEPALKQDYHGKLIQSVNLDALRTQQSEVEGYVGQLKKQLPGKAEMADLLSDINQAALERGLQFELFRPGQQIVKDYYVELPIAIKLTGRYHDMGSFVANVAKLPRIVTLHNLTISASKDAKDIQGVLNMEATARTYRYLDQEELQTQRDEKQKKNAKTPGAQP
jgi:type IV pilus assembly protein PilO